MSELTSSIMDKFSDFVYSPKPGGITDIFADTERVLIQEKINASTNSNKTTEILDGQIKRSKEIQTQIQGMIGDIEKKKESSDNKTADFFRNSFPYGEVEIKEDNTKILESIEKTTIDQMDKSSKEFARLCKTLLPSDYKEEDTDILMDIFGSISDYPIIDRSSNGMMSIRSLQKLFYEFYMNYNTSVSGTSKQFNKDGNGINKQKFFDRFLQVSSLQLGNNEIFDDKNFKTDIGEIFEFNPDLWYADFRLKDAFAEKRVDYFSDSYGAFFRAPGLNEINGRVQINLGNEVNSFSVFGTYTGTNQLFLSNEDKVFCLLFQENFSTAQRNSEILNGYSYPDNTQTTISPNQEVLKYLYNSSAITGLSGTSISQDVKFNKFAIDKRYAYFQNEEKTNTLNTQNGGSKKKLKGGSFANLFDINGNPNLLAKRSPKKFNPIIFEKTIRKFEIEKQKYSKDKILEKILTTNKFPIFYHDLTSKLGDKSLTYEELRFIFHVSSVYTTYKKLFIHFLTNIALCYNYYSTVIVPKFIKNSKNAKNAVIFMPNKIDKLISQITKMISKLNSDLLQPGAKNVPIEDLFIGFKISDLKTNREILQDSYFKDFCLLAIMPNEFKKFMQMYCLEKKIVFGGIPVTLSKESFNKNIPYCFKFFLQYRILANKNFIELLELYKKQNEQKPSKIEYEAIEKFVKEYFDKYISPLSTATIQFQNYQQIIFRSILFAITEFIKTLNNLELKIKHQSQIKSTSRLEITNKSTNNPTQLDFKKIGEFKQKIFNFIYNLKNLQLDHNLYLFLYGQLFQFIYRIDEFMNYNVTMTPEKFRQKFESLGIDMNMTQIDIQQKAMQITEVLTDFRKSLQLKQRFFGLFSPKVDLQNNAKRLLSMSIDPEALKPYWWVNKEKEYLKLSGGRRLFVICVEPVVNLGKLSKLNIWFNDLFATAQSQMKPMTRNYIKTIEEVGSNGIVKKEYYGDNQMVMLNPYIRTIREFKGDLQKWVTKDPDWWKDPTGVKKTITQLFTNKAKKMQQGEYGRLFADWLGIHQLKKKNSGGINQNKTYENFKNSAVLTRLIQGKLDSYTETNNRSNKLKFSLLMGYDHPQLNKILIRHLTAMQKGQRFASDAKSYDDWQLYLIQSKDYSSIESFRMWAFNLLMSKPWVFNKETMSGEVAIPISNFSKMQVPFKNFFVKVGDFGISSVLLDFYKLITEEAMKNSTNIKEKKIFIPQVDLSELELPRNKESINMVEGISREFKNKLNDNSSKKSSSSINGLIGTPRLDESMPVIKFSNTFGSIEPVRQQSLFGESIINDKESLRRLQHLNLEQPQARRNSERAPLSELSLPAQSHSSSRFSYEQPRNEILNITINNLFSSATSSNKGIIKSNQKSKTLLSALKNSGFLDYTKVEKKDINFANMGVQQAYEINFQADIKFLILVLNGTVNVYASYENGDFAPFFYLLNQRMYISVINDNYYCIYNSNSIFLENKSDNKIYRLFVRKINSTLKYAWEQRNTFESGTEV
jgi:hypothetical protein